MKILGTGLSGLVGSRVVELLADNHEFENLSLETGVDITDRTTVDRHVDASGAAWVFHFAARTDVDGAEAERESGEASPTWVVNVKATEHIVNACKRTGKKLLYISTDFVFDGKEDSYREEGVPNPLGWYAKTKFEGERRVAALGDQGLIVRIAFPYRASYPTKPDFVARIVRSLSAGEEVAAPTDNRFVPTLIDDIAQAIETLMTQNCHGVYHVVGSDAVSGYEATALIAHTYGLPESLVKKTTSIEYFRGRAPRPFHAVLQNDKITALGVAMHGFAEGLEIVKRQQDAQ